MQNNVKKLMARFFADKRKQKKLAAFASVMSVLVVAAVFWNLMQPVITMTPDAICGKTEHAHDANCYANQLVCTLAESEEHAHTDACYSAALICEKSEHAHDASCYPEKVSEPTIAPTATPEVTADPAEEPAAPASEDEPTAAPSAGATPEPTATVDPTATVEATATVEPTETASTEPTVEPAETTEATATVEPAATAEATATVEPAATAEAIATVEPTATIEATATVDATTEPEVTPDPSATVDPSASPEASPEATEEAPADENALTVDATANAAAVFAGDSVTFTLTYTGEPMTTVITVAQGDKAHAATTELTETITVTAADSATPVVLDVAITDAEGNIASDRCEVLVAVHKEETESEWKASAKAELTANWPEDLLAVARTQLGYTESAENFVINDEGKIAGYTRYGDWYGAEYDEWCAMFISFCLEYAEISEEYFPQNANCESWIDELSWRELYAKAENYTPSAGDLIFFDWENDETVDHVGIVTGISSDYIYTLEGNSGASVRENTYARDDEIIVGYGRLTKAYEQFLEDQTLEVEPEKTLGHIVPVSADVANLRAEPSADASIVAQAEEAETVELLSYIQNDDGWTWFEVAYGEHTGYIRGDLLDLSGTDLPFLSENLVPDTAFGALKTEIGSLTAPELPAADADETTLAAYAAAQSEYESAKAALTEKVAAAHANAEITDEEYAELDALLNPVVTDEPIDKEAPVESEATEPSAEEENPVQVAMTVEVQDEVEYIVMTAAIDESIAIENYNWQWQVAAALEGPWTNIEGATGMTYSVLLTEETYASYYRIYGAYNVIEDVPVVTEEAATFAISRSTAPASETDEAANDSAQTFAITPNTDTDDLASGGISLLTITPSTDYETASVGIYYVKVDGNNNVIGTPESATSITIREGQNNEVDVKADIFDESKGTYVAAYISTTTDMSGTAANYIRYDCPQSPRRYIFYYSATENGAEENITTEDINNFSNYSLYIYYRPNTVAITFDYNGGTDANGKASSALDVIPNTTIPAASIPVPTRNDGYVIIGWTSDAEGQNAVDLTTQVITAATTFYAKWEKGVTVTLAPGYADASAPAEVKVAALESNGNKLSASAEEPAWTREGYEFDGWLIGNNEVPVAWVDVLETEFTADTTVTAKWTKLHTITFNPGEGSGEAVTITVRNGEGIPAETAEPGADWLHADTKYRFAEWLNSSNVPHEWEDILELTFTADATFTANWRNSVTISFDLNGKVGVTPDPIYVSYETSLNESGQSLPTSVVLEGANRQVLEGWYTSPDCTTETKFNPTEQLTADVTLFANWVDAGTDTYFVFFYDFEREGNEDRLVIATIAVPKDSVVVKYNPGAAPEGQVWNEEWYTLFGEEGVRDTAFDFTKNVSDSPALVNNDNKPGDDARNLHLYPGVDGVWKVTFVTGGTPIAPVNVKKDDEGVATINLDNYVPTLEGATFAGWYKSQEEAKNASDAGKVSGTQYITENVTYYGGWTPKYVAFNAMWRGENADDTNFTVMGSANGGTDDAQVSTWYALAGSTIKVNSKESNGEYTHEVVCVYNGAEYPVYTRDPASLQNPQNYEAELDDEMESFFVYNNSVLNNAANAEWTDVYGVSHAPPYSSGVQILANGTTAIFFDYMRVRVDVTFTIDNATGNDDNGAGYFDIYTLSQAGGPLASQADSIVGSDGQKLSSAGNVSATGTGNVSKISWEYTAVTGNTDNKYVLKNVKYEQNFSDVYPVGNQYITLREDSDKYAQWVYNGTNQTSRLENLTSKLISGTGRDAVAYVFAADFDNESLVALMYAIECLPDELVAEDYHFYIGNGENRVYYKVATQYSEIVNAGTNWTAKQLLGCQTGYVNYYDVASNGEFTRESVDDNSKLQGTLSADAAEAAFDELWTDYYATDEYGTRAEFGDVDGNQYARVFYYNRHRLNLQFNFNYDKDNDGSNEVVTYSDLLYGTNLNGYRYAGNNDGTQHALLTRPGYTFVGWVDADGKEISEERWAEMELTGTSGSTMTFFAKWDKISDAIVEFYLTKNSSTPFTYQFVTDGEPATQPDILHQPDGWVWTPKGSTLEENFNFNLPMYGAFAPKQEWRTVKDDQGNEVQRYVWVIKVYGIWTSDMVQVIYDANEAEGGVQEKAPVEKDEAGNRINYALGVMVPVKSMQGAADEINTQGKTFVGWVIEEREEESGKETVHQPGEYVVAQWMPTMTFVAQWADAGEVVHLKYDPNGGIPETEYPDATGFAYARYATASVWNNQKAAEGGATAPHYTRTGYTFAGWNTQADGSGVSYAPGDQITLTADMTILYAMWTPAPYQFTIWKYAELPDMGTTETVSLKDAVFEIAEKTTSGWTVIAENAKTAGSGTFTIAADAQSPLKIDTVYRVIETKAPAGYNMLTEIIYFKVTVSEDDGSIVLQFCDESGAAISDTPKMVSGSYTAGSNTAMLNIANIPGTELPSTGGTGTSVYTMAGLLLMATSLVYGCGLKRRRGRGARR